MKLSADFRTFLALAVAWCVFVAFMANVAILYVGPPTAPVEIGEE